jgi:two-component system, NarL family, captular synthesis response regulator RcsB
VAFRYDIYLADDHEAVRIGVGSVLEGTEFVVAGETGTGDGLLALLRLATPDALVTDLAMPGEAFADGIDLVTHVARAYPTLPIVVLTMSRGPVVLEALLAAGIRGIVDKSAPLTNVPRALRQVIAGRTFLSDAFAASSPSAPQTALSVEEERILRLLAEGHGLTDIAGILGKSVSTVSTYKRRAMKKAGVTSNHDLRDYIRRMVTARPSP